MKHIHKKQGYVGIMVSEKPGTPPFASQSFYSRLCRIGHKLGIVVFVFFPERLRLTEPSVDGYTYGPEEGEWRAGTFPLPRVIYDRCFFGDKASYKRYRDCLHRLEQHPDIRLLGHGLRGKWQVHQMLMRHEPLRAHLPPTKRLVGWNALQAELNRLGEVFLKPEAGSKGKGVLRVSHTEDGYRVSGRTRDNEIIRKSFPSESGFRQWLTAFTGGRPYLIQPYLQLNARNGDPFDVRCLVQKNRKGVWTVTGTAVRRGQRGGVTSNLHGGGIAEDLDPFLRQEFGARQAEHILGTLQHIAIQIPAVLEQHHGRLAELGIDLGIDASGTVWILEANSKPGRSAFDRLSDPTSKLASVRNPILYARYLLDTTRRVIS
ncbi:YheC/YheD family protein [Paenibacillus sp. HJGM_3]|uniref:YheC/YheD family endospore coat-associated protein n=1 Tax=Paenibacillus sp. HJGM_3 TaxID=3379816 RepID=UPI00385D32CF